MTGLSPIVCQILALLFIPTGAHARAVESKSNGKVVLITGAFRGLGLKLSEDLLREGYRVVMTGRRLGDAPEWVNAHPSALALPLDVQDEASIGTILATVEAKWHRLDAIVHNANLTTLSSSLSLRPDVLDQAMHTNFQGPARLTQLAIPMFKRQHFGRIIYLSSAATLLHEPEMAAYNASKAAAEAYFLTLADEIKRAPEFRPDDIDVSVLRLSFVKSDYEPKVEVAESVGADRRSFVKVMAFLRNHSPTTDLTVARAIRASIEANEAPRLTNLGLDGKMVLGASMLPQRVRAACEGFLATALSFTSR